VDFAAYVSKDASLERMAAWNQDMAAGSVHICSYGSFFGWQLVIEVKVLPVDFLEKLLRNIPIWAPYISRLVMLKNNAACACASDWLHQPPGIYPNLWLVGGLEHGFHFSIYWECHNPD
jgi:hypothetical protein